MGNLEMILAAAISESVSPSFYGMVVIVGLQLSQFFFNYRKDQSREQSAKKADLTVLRGEFREEMKLMESKLGNFRAEVELKMETNRIESERSRTEMQTKINEVAVSASALLKGQSLTEQTLNSLSAKLDALVSRPANRTR